MAMPGRSMQGCVCVCLYACVCYGGRVIDVFLLGAGVGVTIKHQTGDMDGPLTPN